MAEEVRLREAYRRLRARLSLEEVGNMYFHELIAELRNELERFTAESKPGRGKETESQ